jgi:hypothetical protein
MSFSHILRRLIRKVALKVIDRSLAAATAAAAAATQIQCL